MLHAKHRCKFEMDNKFINYTVLHNTIFFVYLLQVRNTLISEFKINDCVTISVPNFDRIEDLRTLHA